MVPKEVVAVGNWIQPRSGIVRSRAVRVHLKANPNPPGANLMHLNRLSRVPVFILALATAGVSGCEETGDSTPASPQTPPAGGAQSAYGKAQERADRLKDQIDDYQQQVIRQADSVFDSSAPRVGEGGVESIPVD